MTGPSRLPTMIPPFRFAMVEENLYRGGYPKPRNYRFLKRLRLKTILSLIPEQAAHDLQQFCKEEAIHMLRLKVDRMKEDNITLTYNKTLMAIHIIIDPTNHPIYVHCLDGADVTGLIMACLRRLQRWEQKYAMLEFTRHLHTSIASSEEYEFVENFRNFEIMIPARFPVWLNGCLLPARKHPCLRLNTTNLDEIVGNEKDDLPREDLQKRASATGRSANTNEGARHANSTVIAPPVEDDDLHDSDGIPNEEESDGHDHDHDHLHKDKYMVDVEMDDVMIDGLDQVTYFGRHMDDDEPDLDVFWNDPLDDTIQISRTLEALALEGLE